MEAPSNFEQGDALYDAGKFEEAFAAFSAGAQAGDASCMSRLGHLYTLGAGIPCCDYDKALEWETRAYEAGDAVALFNLAITHRLKGNIFEYKACLERALHQGDNSAALELAKLYMISDKETETVTHYLVRVISDSSLSEAEREEAEELLSRV